MLKKNLDFDIFYKVDCLESINPFLERMLRKLFKLEAELNRLRIYPRNMIMIHPQNNYSTQGLLTFFDHIILCSGTILYKVECSAESLSSTIRCH